MSVATEAKASTILPTPTYSLVELNRELRAAGLGNPNALPQFAKFFLITAAALACLLLILAFPEQSLWLKVPTALLGGWFMASACMCGHDGAHDAASRSPFLNNLLAQLGFTFLGGLSVMYWRHKHNSLHHPNVNVAKTDPDIEQGLLSLSTRQYREQRPAIRWLQQRFQALGFWGFGAPLVGVDLKITSVRFLFGALWRGQTPRRPLLIDLGWTVAHYVTWLVLPLAVLPFSTLLAIYAVATVLAGVFLTLIFAPAHMPYPLVRESSDPLLLQLTSTRNFPSNAFFRFTMIGLDHQIEHHVAPRLPHFELEKAAVIVRAYCARHGLPYHETSWLEALRDTTTQVRDGWRLDEIVVGAPEAPLAAAPPPVGAAG